MGEETRVERRKGSYISDSLLKTVGALSLAAAMGLAGWSLSEVYSAHLEIESLKSEHKSLKERVDRLDARHTRTADKIEERLKEIIEKIDRLNDRINGRPNP